MRYGFLVPMGDPRTVAELARETEEAGWDGAFYWDGICVGEMDTYDPWVVMAAMAMLTEGVRIGAVLTPPARRRPWKLARETVALDHLSGGRLVLPVGLGALDDGGFSKVGEPTDRKVRAKLLDESLEILTGLWSEEPFSYEGEHYQLEEMTFRPPPVQRPRIPIWVVGAWASRKSMGRALRHDGVLVATIGGSAESSPASRPRPYARSKRTPRRTAPRLRPSTSYGRARRRAKTPGGPPPSCVPTQRPGPRGGSNPLDPAQRARRSTRPHKTGTATSRLELVSTLRLTC
ncbi:MAG TPA: LLM class flavin-dependent oxidoreductase [Rubrobacter sp.]